MSSVSEGFRAFNLMDLHIPIEVQRFAAEGVDLVFGLASPVDTKFPIRVR